MGPRQLHSTSLSRAEEAAAVAFRQKTLLPLDDCLHALQRVIPSLTRSRLHRLFQRHGISQLPKPMGYLHLDSTEVQTAEGKAYRLIAIDVRSHRIPGARDAQGRR